MCPRLFSWTPALIRKNQCDAHVGVKEHPIVRYIKAWVTHLTGGVRHYLSTAPSPLPPPLLLVSLGDKNSQTRPELFHTTSFATVFHSPWTPLVFTVWRKTLTINMSLHGRASGRKGENNLYGPGDDFHNELCFLSEPDKAVNRFYNLLLKGGRRKKEEKKSVLQYRERCKVVTAPRHWINSIWAYSSRKWNY